MRNNSCLQTGGKCAPLSSYQFVGDRLMFPPMTGRDFTNKSSDWLKLLEGGIFQYESLKNPRPKCVHVTNLE